MTTPLAVRTGASALAHGAGLAGLARGVAGCGAAVDHAFRKVELATTMPKTVVPT